jgi:hypothetical protein
LSHWSQTSNINGQRLRLLVLVLIISMVAMGALAGIYDAVARDIFP